MSLQHCVVIGSRDAEHVLKVVISRPVGIQAICLLTRGSEPFGIFEVVGAPISADPLTMFGILPALVTSQAQAVSFMFPIRVATRDAQA